MLSAFGVLVWWLRTKQQGQRSASTKTKAGFASGMTKAPYVSNRTNDELEAPGARGAAELEARERAKLEARERGELEAREGVSRAEIG